MGRKKRKADDVGGTSVDDGDDEGVPPPLDPRKRAAAAAVVTKVEEADDDDDKDDKNINEVTPKKEDKPLASGYAMTTHSAEIVDEDIYVSDGSNDEEDEIMGTGGGEEEGGGGDGEDDIDIVLVGSRMGIMRRGIHHPMMLVQPNRQWVRDGGDAANATTAEGDTPVDAEEAEKAKEEELAKLDPAQRAARLLAEKQRKLEEAKELARRVESEENAGRDPCLFSKRTAFDIRFDQIDDKPWSRGGDLTDFFNYNMGEEDWLEYAEQQLLIRQELTDANRQRRPPDPAIVPVQPRAPSKQTPRVAVAVSAGSDAGDGVGEDGEPGPAIGPTIVEKEELEAAAAATTADSNKPEKEKEVFEDVNVVGGAWGAGAAPGSLLAKLIEEQEQKGPVEEDTKPSVHLMTNNSMDVDSHFGPGISGPGSYAGDTPRDHYRRGSFDHQSQGGNDWNQQGGPPVAHHPGGGGSVGGADWDNQSLQSDFSNRRGAGHYGHQQYGGGEPQHPPPQQWNQGGGSRGDHYGGRGRGGYDNRYGGGGGGRGRGGRGGGRGGRGGGFRDRSSYQGGGGGSYGDGGGGGSEYPQRKRHRDDSRGGWKR